MTGPMRDTVPGGAGGGEGCGDTSGEVFILLGCGNVDTVSFFLLLLSCSFILLFILAVCLTLTFIYFYY